MDDLVENGFTAKFFVFTVAPLRGNLLVATYPDSNDDTQY